MASVIVITVMLYLFSFYRARIRFLLIFVIIRDTGIRATVKLFIAILCVFLSNTGSIDRCH